MLAYNEVREKKYIVLDDAPYEVLEAHVFRKQQRRPVNAAKLRHLVTGKVVEHSFQQSDKVAEAEIVERPVKYLYSHRGEHWFGDETEPKNRFRLEEALVGDKIRFLRPDSSVIILSFNDRVIGLKLPIKVELKVIEAPPATRGNTIQGAVKKVILETGAEINVPLFVQTGDLIRVNTDTAEYLERVNKIT